MIGCVGALLANLTSILLYKLKVDDPVGVIPVHGTCAIWGLLAVGKFLSVSRFELWYHSNNYMLKTLSTSPMPKTQQFQSILEFFKAQEQRRKSDFVKLIST